MTNDTLNIARECGATISEGNVSGVPIVAFLPGELEAFAARIRSVPKGWQMVPVKPTDQMLREMVCQWDSIGHRNVATNYAALLAAAPTPPAIPKEPEPGDFVMIRRATLEGLIGSDDYHTQGSPNHSHRKPGIWDSDNADKAGKPCAECALFDEARALLAAPRAEQPAPAMPLPAQKPAELMEIATLAHRILNECYAVLCTIEGESDDEDARIKALAQSAQGVSVSLFGVIRAMLTEAATPRCGCGKPIRYETQSGMACNKYMRCLTREEAVDALQRANARLYVIDAAASHEGPAEPKETPAP